MDGDTLLIYRNYTVYRSAVWQRLSSYTASSLFASHGIASIEWEANESRAVLSISPSCSAIGGEAEKPSTCAALWWVGTGSSSLTGQSTWRDWGKGYIEMMNAWSYWGRITNRTRIRAGNRCLPLSIHCHQVINQTTKSFHVLTYIFPQFSSHHGNYSHFFVWLKSGKDELG